MELSDYWEKIWKAKCYLIKAENKRGEADGNC